MTSWLNLSKDAIRRYISNPTVNTRPLGGLGFDWLMIALFTWSLAGLYLDGWAHNHHQADNSFFTPWHALIYSGLFSVTLALAVTYLRNLVQGHSWSRAMPPGYGLSILGVLISNAGGVGDFIWHTLFGIEASVDALYSPTHLILALGGMLMLLGPFRAGWNRNSVQWPMVFSLGYALALLTFFSQPFHPFSVMEAAGTAPPRAIASERQSLGIASILLHTIMMLGMILFALRRKVLPIGSMTFLIGFTSALATLNNQNDDYWIIPAAVLAGIVADVLIVILKPSLHRIGAWRLFAFAVPAILYLFYFSEVIVVRGTWWSVHLWVGSIVLAGITGWILSYAFIDASQIPVHEIENG